MGLGDKILNAVTGRNMKTVKVDAGQLDTLKKAVQPYLLQAAVRQ